MKTVLEILGKTKRLVGLLICVLAIALNLSCEKKDQAVEKLNHEDLVIRIAELTIEPEYVEEYLALLKEVSEASVRLEPGVICHYPMYEKENPRRIRILEIYRSQQAYEDHLYSDQFKKYKSSSRVMVESLELIDMEVIDPKSITRIFAKIKN